MQIRDNISGIIMWNFGLKVKQSTRIKKHQSYQENLQNLFAWQVAPSCLLTICETQLYSNVTPLSDKSSSFQINLYI